MSRARRRLEQLAGVRELRVLAEHLAMSQAVRLANETRAQEARCRDADALFQHALRDWRSALSAGAFDPAAAAIHAQAVRDRDAAKAQTGHALAALEARLDEARRESAQAAANNRCAQELLTDARRRHRRTRDEKAWALGDDENAARAELT